MKRGKLLKMWKPMKDYYSFSWLKFLIWQEKQRIASLKFISETFFRPRKARLSKHIMMNDVKNSSANCCNSECDNSVPFLSLMEHMSRLACQNSEQFDEHRGCFYWLVVCIRERLKVLFGKNGICKLFEVKSRLVAQGYTPCKSFTATQKFAFPKGCVVFE